MLAAHTSGNALNGHLVVSEVKDPRLHPSEVLIDVMASSVNPLDWKILKGVRYLPFTKLVLGHDVAGFIAKVGAKVTDFEVGDEVYCCLPGIIGGANAERVNVPANMVMMKPSNISMQEAAATPLAALTAWQALNQTHIKKGDSVLIIGASGGVGTFAVQIAKALSAHVTGVCSTKHLGFVRSLGADQVIDYTSESIFEQEDKYDIVFDVIGHESLHSCESIIREGGHYITTNPSPRSILDIVTHVAAFSPTAKHASFVSMKANAKDLKRISALIKVGKVKPIIDKEFALTEIDDAYAYSRLGHSTGKIVINMQ